MFVSLARKSRPIAALISTLLTALTTTAAATLAYFLFNTIKKSINDAGSDLNISAYTGREPFAFSWTATSLSIWALGVQAGQCFCFWRRHKVQEAQTRKTDRRRGRRGHREKNEFELVSIGEDGVGLLRDPADGRMQSSRYSYISPGANLHTNF
jgi:hypothetical protein